LVHRAEQVEYTHDQYLLALGRLKMCSSLPGGLPYPELTSGLGSVGFAQPKHARSYAAITRPLALTRTSVRKRSGTHREETRRRDRHRSGSAPTNRARTGLGPSSPSRAALFPSQYPATATALHAALGPGTYIPFGCSPCGISRSPVEPSAHPPVE